MPTAVVISEAVELAKQYSTENSGRFVNGLLAEIAEQVRAASVLSARFVARRGSGHDRRRPSGRLDRGRSSVGTDMPWIVIVWNDPVNLMNYVVMSSRRSSGTPGRRRPA